LLLTFARVVADDGCMQPTPPDPHLDGHPRLAADGYFSATSPRPADQIEEEGPFTAETLQVYRNLGAVVLVVAAFFAFSTTGTDTFKAGLHIGISVVLAAVACFFFWCFLYVRSRLDEPMGFWQQQQRRWRPLFFRAVYLIATISGAAVATLLQSGDSFWAGLACAPGGAAAFLAIGQLTGQIGEY
jgi:hypothetical protein